MGIKTNIVVAGDYTGGIIIEKKSLLGKSNGLFLTKGFKKPIELDNSTIEEWKELDKDETKSASSAFVRGVVGSAAGPIGTLAGITSAKNKKEYTIAIKWKDEKVSKIILDRKYFEQFTNNMFKF